MPVEVTDVLKANIVLVGVGLLSTPPEIDAFSKAIGAEVGIAEGVILGLPTGLPGIPGAGRKLALQRDRISIESAPGRTTIEREFPTEDDVDRLARVIDQAVKFTTTWEESLIAYGYNLELVYGQNSGESALQYLGNRLFAGSTSPHENWSLVGGAGQMIFDSPSGRWSVRIEPRFNDVNSSRVFLSVNLHKAEEQLPEFGGIRRTFREVWGQAHAFINKLDERAL